MSKPILQLQIATLDGKTGEIRALFDTRSFYTIVRQDKVPAGAAVVMRSKPLEMRGAGRGNRLTVTGEVPLVLTIGLKMIEDGAMVSPDLVQEMLVGAKTMQAWDITIAKRNGDTSVVVGRDMRDPDFLEVD